MQTIVRYTKQFVQYVRNNQAVSALEYALLVGIIVVAATIALIQLGDSVKGTIEKSKQEVNKAKSKIPNVNN